MNTKLPGVGYLLANGGLKWDTAKWRMYAIDMDIAGPVPGTYQLKSNNATDFGPDVVFNDAVTNNGTLTISVPDVLSNNTPWTPATYKLRIQTQEPHGLSVGDRISIPHRSGGILGYNKSSGALHYYGEIVKPGATGGTSPYRQRCVHSGNADGTEQTWPSTPGTFIRQLGANVNSSWVTEKFPHTSSPLHTSNWVVSDIFSDRAFGFYTNINGENIGSYIGGYVVPLDVLYLTDIAPQSEAVWAVSEPILGRSYTDDYPTNTLRPYQGIQAGTIEFLDIPSTGSGHILVLAQVSPDADDPFDEYQPEEQIIIAMWDYWPLSGGKGLPLTPSMASAGYMTMNMGLVKI